MTLSKAWMRSGLSAILATALMSITGCSSGNSGNEILIGHYASMSGSESTFGKSTDNGIQLAIEETNAAGGINGKKIRLITHDDQSKTPEAGAAATRLVYSDKVTAVLGEVASSMSLAGVAPVCQEAGIPMVSPSSTDPKVTQIGDKIFRVCFIDPFQGQVCAKFARENLKAAKAAILFDQSGAYSTGLAEEFKKAFEKMGGTIVEQQAFNKADQDFTPQLGKIRGANPDVVFVPAYYSQVGNIAIQVRRLGIKVPLLGGDGWDSEQLATIAGDAIEGCYYSNHYSQEDTSPRVQEFIKKYEAKYEGKKPDGLAALGYDAAMILFNAMRNANSLAGDELAAALAATKDFDGVTGKITINAERNAVKPAVMLKMVKDGPTYVPKYVSTIEPPK